MLPYLILIILFSLLSEFRYRGNHILRIPALLLLILFIGLRNEVGADYNAYEVIFEESRSIDYGDWYIEPGWHFLNRVILGFTSEFKVLTLIHASAIVVLLYLSLKDFRYYTFAFILFILVSAGYISIVNQMRQGVAMAIFFYSWRFIRSREILKYSICILLGASIHVSIVFVAPMYWIVHKTYDAKLLFVIQFITLFCFFTHISDVLFVKLISLTSYGHYIDSHFMESGLESGMGFLARRIISFVVLLCYGRLVKCYPKYTVWVNMYFLMVVTSDLFANIVILARMTKYFCWSTFVVIPLFLSAMFKAGESRLLARAFMLAFYFTLFTYTVYTDIGNNLLYTF